jgi:hypothetical protein
MILHFSRSLAKRLRCQLSFAGTAVEQPGCMDSWSADLFRLRGIGSHALVMHDASLWPIILPLEGCKRYEDFLALLLYHVEASYLATGGQFDRGNLTVVTTRRSNRRIIGSMNEAKRLLAHLVSAMFERSGDVDWSAARHQLAQTPFFAVEGLFPAKRFAQLVAEHQRGGV